MAVVTYAYGTASAASVATAAAAPAARSPIVNHWGSFFGDNLGTSKDHLYSPTPITLPGPVKEVATSNSTEYALLTDGTVWAWGQGDHGEFGDGQSANSFSTPVQVQFPAGVSISWLPTDAMPFDTGLAVDSTGQAWGWGLNSAGELCLGEKGVQSTPVKLPTFTDVTAMAGAGDHTLLDQDGTVYACGGNASGDLGDGKHKASSTPVAVDLHGLNVSHLYASYENSGALTRDGRYFDWGFDAEDQLGSGQTGVASPTPVKVALPAPVSQVALGGSYTDNGQTLVLLSDGDMYAWGDDNWGQLGDAQTANEPSPELITPPAGVSFSQLASGASTSYGVTATGTLYAWGDGASGQMGDGGTGDVLTPTVVETDVKLISSTANDVAVSG